MLPTSGKPFGPGILDLCLYHAGPPGWDQRYKHLMIIVRVSIVERVMKLMEVHLDFEASAKSQSVSMCVDM